MSLHAPDYSTNRYEIKYLSPAREVRKIKENLADLFVEDPHNGEVNQGYYNQSIYFDSHDLAHYREKQEGQNVRVKVRLRAHKKMPDGKPTRYFIELKHRFGAVGKKDRYILDENQAMDVLNGRTLPGLTPDHYRQNTDDVPASFYYLSRKSIFQPVVSVLYHRAAYHSKMYPGIRLTYDTGVRASSLISFDSPLSSFYPSLDPRHCVIELKYPSVAPRLLLKRLNELGLQQITLSKYSSAVESIFHQLVCSSHPRYSAIR